MEGLLQPHALAEEVESLKNSIFIAVWLRLISLHLSTGVIDDAGRIFCVMQHQLVQVVVVFAGEGEGTVVLLDELDNLTHAVLGKTCLKMRKIELANQSPRHGKITP